MIAALAIAACVPALCLAQDGLLDKGLLRAGPAGPSRLVGEDAQKASANDIVYLRNGDSIGGAFIGSDGIKTLYWSRPDVEEPIEWDGANVMAVQLAARREWSQAATNPAQLRLTNGDLIEGEFLGLDANNISLKTWFAGNLSIPRQFSRSLSFLPPASAQVFSGPVSDEGWTHGKVAAAGAVAAKGGQWRFHNGAFYSNTASSVARDVHLPDSASIQFDLAWRGYFVLAVALYTEYLHPIQLLAKDKEPNFGGFYSLQLNPLTADLLPVKKNDPLRYLGQVPTSMLNQKTSAHFEIRVSKVRRSTALLIDNVLIKQWNETEDFAGTGSAVRFVHGGRGALRLSRIRVTEWDGLMDDVDFGATNRRAKQSSLFLKNGDRVTGDLDTFKIGTARIKAAAGPMDIPGERVKRVELASAESDPPLKSEVDSKLLFLNGGVLSFKLQSWSTNKVRGLHPLLGPLEMDPAAFSRVDFSGR